jgi:hypothetical protein
VITFGLGLGYRTSVLSGRFELLDLSISPYDSTLQVDTLARAKFILSGLVVAQPFRGGHGFWKNFLFLADVNLAEFGGKDAVSVSNKAIEGGAGFGYRLDDYFSFGFSAERLSTRKPRAFVLQRLGQKVPGVTRISTDDDALYRNANVAALTLWFIYKVK